MGKGGGGSIFTPKSIAKGSLFKAVNPARLLGKGLQKYGSGVGLGGVGQALEDVGSLGDSAKKRVEQQKKDMAARQASLEPGKQPKIEEIRKQSAKSAAARQLRTEAKTGRQDTILTSPLGLTGQPLLRKKTLLGQ